MCREGCGSTWKKGGVSISLEEKCQDLRAHEFGMYFMLASTFASWILATNPGFEVEHFWFFVMFAITK